MKPANYAPVYAAALYPQWAEIAREHGYALAVHGSCARDFDLICIPWIDRPAAPEVVLQAITSQFAAKLIGGPPTVRPHGRIAYTLSIGFGECAVDMQFMLRRDAEHLCHGVGGAHKCGDSRCWAKHCAALPGARPSKEWYAEKITETMQAEDAAGGVLGAGALGVEGGYVETKRDQTPIPSPMDNEGEG